jgi:hypothetical protein
LSSRIKRSIRKSGGGFLALANLVSFVTSRLPVDVMFLPKYVCAPSGDGGRFLGLAACGPTRPPTSCSGVVGGAV